MKLHKRYLGCVNWPGANQTSTFQIPRNYALVALEYELAVSLTRTAGQAGEAKDCSPAQLVKSLDLIANGQDTLKRIDLETLHRKNQLQFGTRPRIYSEALSGHGAITEAVTTKVAARLCFAMPRSVSQVDTLLDTAALSSLDLVITWGAENDIMNDAYDGAVTIADAKLHITAIEYIGVPAGQNFAVWKENWKRAQVVGADNNFQIKLPYGSNLNYRGILIKTHSDGDQVDTILPYDGLTNLNKITLRSGTEVYMYEIAQLLQVQNRLQHAMEVPERIGSAAALNHRLQELVLEGYYYIDFCRDGRLSEMLNTSMLSDLELMLEVAHPGTNDFIDIYLDHVLPPPKVTTA